MMHDDDDSRGERRRSKTGRGPGNGIELVAVMAFFCVFIGAAIMMARMASGMGVSIMVPMVPLGMAGVGVLMLVATLVKFSKRRHLEAQLHAAREEQHRIESLELRAREAESHERLRRATESARMAERIACEYCGVTRAADEQVCDGCGSRRK